MSDEQYLIWSNEHRAWWRPNSAGYTRDVRAAGRYDRITAIEISGSARRGWTDPKRLPDELAINIQDLPPEIFASILAHDPVSSQNSLETCPTCMGSGYSNHPDSGEICHACKGSGGAVSTPSNHPTTKGD